MPSRTHSHFLQLVHSTVSQTFTCIGIKKPAQKPRNRVLADDELCKVWKRAREIGYPVWNDRSASDPHGAAAGEIAGLHWEWIEGEMVTFPGEITKNARVSKIPLGVMARRVVDRDTPARFLLPARGHATRPFNGYGAGRRNLADQCGVGDFTHHDLRRTFATSIGLARRASRSH